MAGDWIPLRLDLDEDPAIIWMAEKLQQKETEIVGNCHKIWSWLSRNSHDGSVTLVTLSSLGRVTNLPGFPELMHEVGWLDEETRDGVSVLLVPNWDRWLSQSAKKRLLAAQRKRKSRHAAVTNSCDKSVTTGEKRREEKSNKNPHSPPSKNGTATSDIDAIVDHYRAKHPRARPGAKERKLIAARLGEGYSPADLRQAIDGNHASPFHRGVNDDGKKFHGLALIFRDSDHVREFIELATGQGIRRGPEMPGPEDYPGSYRDADGNITYGPPTDEEEDEDDEF